jgi:transcriptional regulator with XRE-family HTH domain
MADEPSLSKFASLGRKKFARNLYAVRIEKSLSDTDVAARCCFSLRKLRALERARVEPNSTDLVKLTSVLGVSVDVLLADIRPQDFYTKDLLTERMLKEIEEGDRRARLVHVVQLAQGLNLEPSALLDGMNWGDGVLYYEGEAIEE